MNKTKKKSDFYNDPTFNYLDYWDKRSYEHAAEEIAIKRLLKDRHFQHAVDIGGGYGRLCLLLENYADQVTLAEPSAKQLAIAQKFLAGHEEIDRQLTQADDLPFNDGSIDLITMIRVMHHLPDPTKEFAEINRVLRRSGYLILEVANYLHIRNRLKHMAKIKRFKSEPVDIRSNENRHANEIAFVNHNPKTVIKQLVQAGFKIEAILSVSNLRSPMLKKLMPASAMLGIEKILQPTLAKTYFGPSVFILVKKV